MKNSKTIAVIFAAALLAGCQEPKPKDFWADYRADYTYCFNKIEKGPDARKGKGMQFALHKLGLRDECLINERGWVSIEHLRKFQDEWYRKYPGVVVTD